MAPHSRKREYNFCPRHHKIIYNSRSTRIVTTCGTCLQPIVFFPGNWECPLCGDTEHLAGDNDPFYMLQRCHYCKRHYIMAFRSDTQKIESFFMSPKEEKEFLTLYQAKRFARAVAHVCGVVRMYETAVNLERIVSEPDIEVEDVIDE